jgi:dihydroxyacetone kinase
VAIDVENKIVYARARGSQTNVSIISGGGSGHEPAFGGFVGAGLLTASVAGTVFASPSSKQVLAAIEGVDSSKGVLVTVMNYTGGVLNFGVAVEKAKARNPKMQIEMLVVGDDVGVPRSRARKVGRRGIAGTVFVHKITGAMAAAGFGFDEIRRVGILVSRSIVSVGVSLNRVHVPGQPIGDASDRTLGADEVELGMGIHNEPGSGRRSGQAAELPALVEEMLHQMLNVDDEERGFLEARADKMVLLVNNLGALSALELGAIVTEVVDQLQKTYSVALARVYAGTYMTSLDGPGFSISLLNVVDTGIDRDILQLLDAPSEALGWPTSISGETWGSKWDHMVNKSSTSTQIAGDEPGKLSCDMGVAVRRLRNGLNAMVAAEPEVTRYDSVVGDGDCGTTLRRGAEGINHTHGP